jgi:calcyclin binding protein
VALGPTTTGSSTSVTYTPIDRFSFDSGGYNEQFVTLYVPLPGVGTIPKDQVQCNFEKAAFDLIVKDLKGKSYRLKKDLLEHDILVNKSKILIKADKILIKLAKIKGEYGSYDHWSKLTDPKRNDKKKNSSPAASITELMKDMYESGDDNMRKMIGETMMKQHRGELGKGTDMGLGDMDLGNDL